MRHEGVVGPIKGSQGLLRAKTVVGPTLYLAVFGL